MKVYHGTTTSALSIKGSILKGLKPNTFVTTDPKMALGYAIESDIIRDIHKGLGTHPSKPIVLEYNIPRSKLKTLPYRNKAITRGIFLTKTKYNKKPKILAVVNQKFTQTSEQHINKIKIGNRIVKIE